MGRGVRINLDEKLNIAKNLTASRRTEMLKEIAFRCIKGEKTVQ